VVTLTTEVSNTLRAHAERTWPEECVGALFSDGSCLALHNAAADRRTGFLVSARDYLATEAHAEAHGLSLSGFYHSHPDGPSQPSVTDAAQATPGLWTLIISVSNGVAAPPRAFRFEEDRFIEGVTK
jgi:proteasome lid subunit RPN8/RPN11